MKSDTERKRFYESRMHERTKRMHVHLSKDLRGKLKQKKRSVLVRAGDKVKVMRGPGKGKSTKVVRVSHQKMKVYLEGITVRNARGKETMQPLQPSNLLLLELEQTKERQKLFTEAAFKKPEKKETPKAQIKPETAGTVEAKQVQPTPQTMVKPAAVEAEIEEEKKAEEKPAAKEGSR